MKLFYTVISQKDQPQSDPMFSLGGFKSSSTVGSAQLNALFGNISEVTLERNEPQYVCLILKNIFDYPVQGATLWFEGTAQSQGKFKVALSESFQGEFESVANIYSKPLYASFEEVNGVEEALEIPAMESGKELALWIERSINNELDDIKKRRDCDFLYSKVGQPLPQLETVSLKIEWTPVIL